MGKIITKIKIHIQSSHLSKFGGWAHRIQCFVGSHPPLQNMYDHTRRILTRALNFIDDYKHNLIGPNQIMGLVSGSLSTLEEELPDQIYASWNSCDWELEMLIVMQPELNQNQKVMECINHFENAGEKLPR